ncbi:MAG TPA: hypothetical protein VG013_23250 [Gemmataceae bacterium]|jgi:hypothetical protein|nr:hypothetical protein [Gemmataceae bacterium]
MKHGLTLCMALLTAGLICPMGVFQRTAKAQPPQVTAADKIFAPAEFALFYHKHKRPAPRIAVRGVIDDIDDIRKLYPSPEPRLELPRMAHYGLVDLADGPADPPEMLIEQIPRIGHSEFLGLRYLSETMAGYIGGPVPGGD